MDDDFAQWDGSAERGRQPAAPQPRPGASQRTAQRPPQRPPSCQPSAAGPSTVRSLLDHRRVATTAAVMSGELTAFCHVASSSWVSRASSTSSPYFHLLHELALMAGPTRAPMSEKVIRGPRTAYSTVLPFQQQCHGGKLSHGEACRRSLTLCLSLRTQSRPTAPAVTCQRSAQ